MPKTQHTMDIRAFHSEAVKVGEPEAQAWFDGKPVSWKRAMQWSDAYFKRERMKALAEINGKMHGFG